MKTCSKCWTSKPATEFYRRNGKADGLQHRCKTCQKKDYVSWTAAHPEKIKEFRRRSRGQVEAPTRPIPVFCELCERKNTRPPAFNEDHDPSTGKFRGWLCHKCDIGLGFLGDNLTGLGKAVLYLERTT